MSYLATHTILYVHASDELYGSDIMLVQLVLSLNRNHFHPIVVLPTDLTCEGLLSRAAVYLARALRSISGPWRDKARAFARGAAELLSLGLAGLREAKR